MQIIYTVSWWHDFVSDEAIFKSSILLGVTLSNTPVNNFNKVTSLVSQTWIESLIFGFRGSNLYLLSSRNTNTKSHEEGEKVNLKEHYSINQVFIAVLKYLKPNLLKKGVQLATLGCPKSNRGYQMLDSTISEGDPLNKWQNKDLKT